MVCCTVNRCIRMPAIDSSRFIPSPPPPPPQKDLGGILERALKPADTPFVTGNGDQNAVDPNDVKQNGYGSCGVLSTLETIAQQNPSAIQDAIHDNGDGTYTVTFHDRDPNSPTGWREVPVTVSGPFDSGAAHKTGDVNSQGQQEIWPRIIEKAYAQQYKTDDQHYSGGVLPSDVMEHLLGQDASTTTPSQIPFGEMEKKLDNGEAVVAWTAGFTPEQQKIADQYGLVGGHAYAVSDVVPKGSTYTDPNTGQQAVAQEDMVILDNPWGHHDVAMPYSAYQETYYQVNSAPTR